MPIWSLSLCLALMSAVPATRALADASPSAEDAARDAAADAARDAAQDSGSAARWKAIAAQIFGDRRIEPAGALIRLDAPTRAEDAALVPITLTMPEKDRIKSVYLVIDDNPAPFAAHVTFGPAADAGTLQLRVRVDSYTNVHAVAETRDGGLYETAAFVKASGGCAAPAGESDELAMSGMGEMRMKFAGAAVPGKPMQATLMVRHPNFNGMQMNQVTRTYTPPRYIDKLSVSLGGSKILDVDADISLATNPVITFSFIPDGKGAVEVVASDTKNGRWEQSFDPPAGTN
jgi:sulfur-oxidizing protein SoxY